MESLAHDKSELSMIWQQRKQEFEQCNELMLFLRDAEQMEYWIVKQEVHLLIVNGFYYSSYNRGFCLLKKKGTV